MASIATHGLTLAPPSGALPQARGIISLVLDAIWTIFWLAVSRLQCRLIRARDSLPLLLLAWRLGCVRASCTVLACCLGLSSQQTAVVPDSCQPLACPPTPMQAAACASAVLSDGLETSKMKASVAFSWISL